MPVSPLWGADPPPPVVQTVFPCGAAVGTTVEVTVAGAHLVGLKSLVCSAPGVECTPLAADRFRLTIPRQTPAGSYDLYAVGQHGLSPPRQFVIGTLDELLEQEPNDSLAAAQSVLLGTAVNGRLGQEGDSDWYRFEAAQGQRVVIDGWCERIDSRMRGVIEVFDSQGRRLAVNRGYHGSDPFVDLSVPRDGVYFVRIQDLIAAGGAEHYYRLELDAGPRAAFTIPAVVEQDHAARVTLYGWNLPGTTPAAGSVSGGAQSSEPALDRLDLELPATQTYPAWPLPLRLQPAQGVIDGFAYHHPGTAHPILIGVTDGPVAVDNGDNHSATTAQQIAIPGHVGGQLAAREERDWYAAEAQRGEVLYLEAYGERMGAPVDLEISVLDSTGTKELARFGDEVQNLGGKRLPTTHLDPCGRWVAPAKGRFLIVVRNLIGGPHDDPRRRYHLSVCRAEPEFHLVVIPHRTDPFGLNLARGGRELLDVVAIGRRGLDGGIRVAASSLPEGVECPDVWLGPGVDRGTLVVSAARSAPAAMTALTLHGTAEGAAARLVRGGTVVRAGTPNGWSRLTSTIPVGVSGEAPLSIEADAHKVLEHHLYGALRVRHSPGGIVDVAVQIDRRHPEHQAPVKLIGIGLPDAIRNETAIIPAGSDRGYVSFYLPPQLPLGKYSFAIRAETTVLVPPDNKVEGVTVCSNPVTIDVQPAAFLLEADRFAPARARRGETFVVRYAAERRNGFIGKIHTELAAPGHITNVPGLRGRGETFVGQTDTGSLQIIVNDDAPLGHQPFVRLLAVGVVEDTPVFQGSSFLPLEIVE
ncbi:MAG: PPC domain-containing protein [Planctomycetales bacterium]